jgi:L-fucose isomerase
MTKAQLLKGIKKAEPKSPVIGVFAPCDPRIDKDSRKRAQNIIQLTADTICGKVQLPDKTPVPVVYSDIEGVDRPQPLVHLISGGENSYKNWLFHRIRG